MTVIIFKIVMFFAAFLVVQASILPWVISNNVLPLWADILIVSFMLFIFMIFIDVFIKKLSILFRNNDD